MKKINGKSILNYFKRAKTEYILIAAVLFVDLLSKFLVQKFIGENDSVILIPKFLSVTYVLNPDAGFSFNFFGLNEVLGEQGMRIFFITFVTLAAAVFALFMVLGRKNHWLYRCAFALIVAGALGNLCDRIFVGQVRDFIMFEYFGKTLFGSTFFPIFNFADSSLVIGVGFFIIYFIFFSSKDEKAKKERLAANNSELQAGSDTQLKADENK